MRRLFMAVTLCAAVLLLALPVSAFATIRTAKEQATRPASVRALHKAGHPFVPLARRLSGSATVNVKILHASGTAAAGGIAELAVWTPEGTIGFDQQQTTNYLGQATFTGVPAAGGTGELLFTPGASDGDYVYDLCQMSWSDPEGASVNVQPANLPVQLYIGGPWRDYFQHAYVDAWSTDVSAKAWTETGILKSGNPTTANAHALSGTLDSAAAYFFCDEGVELQTNGVAVTPGQTVGTTLVAHEADAQRVYNPTWASGKPGSVIKLRLQNFPAGWVNSLTGQDTYTGRHRDYGNWTSTGRAVQTKNLTIPSTATPGRTYLIWADHANGDATLSLYEPFQVCTLIPSENPVRMYHKLIFSGKVPFRAGSSKRVSLYRRYTKPAGQPKYAGGFKSYGGWTKIATATANGVSGKYTFGRFWPSRTAWYCVWYGKDSQHWAAWTSVVKVVKK